MFVLTLTDDKLLKFVLIWGKVVLRLFGEKSWVGPEPFLAYYCHLLKLLIKTVTVALTACKSSHGQESYLRVLNGIFISKEYSILEKQKKNLIPKSIVS